MSNLLQQLNDEMSAVVSQVRQSLVQVRSGVRGAGAGTIWHPDGLIVTNAHVVQDRSLQVALPDGRTLPARLIAQDQGQDVAALVVEASNLPTIELGESRSLKPGQWVISLGHPWGVPGAATAGVVIGAGTDLPGMPAPEREWVAVSLPLRPGHSGGPLVDAAGRLIGINTMMAGPAVGLAVPVHVVKAFLKKALGTPEAVAAA